MHGDPPLSPPHSLQVFPASFLSSQFPISLYLEYYSFECTFKIILSYLLIGHVLRSARNAPSAGSQLRSGCLSLMYKLSFLTLIGAKQENTNRKRKKEKKRVM
jgi:hypothetical protein